MVHLKVIMEDFVILRKLVLQFFLYLHRKQLPIPKKRYTSKVADNSIFLKSICCCCSIFCRIHYAKLLYLKMYRQLLQQNYQLFNGEFKISDNLIFVSESSKQVLSAKVSMAIKRRPKLATLKSSLNWNFLAIARSFLTGPKRLVLQIECCKQHLDGQISFSSYLTTSNLEMYVS